MAVGSLVLGSISAYGLAIAKFAATSTGVATGTGVGTIGIGLAIAPDP